MRSTRRRPQRLLSFALVALTFLSSAAFAALPAEAASKRAIKGIDVSQWDGTIDWKMVASAGKKFAFVKATESTSFIDPKFATNRAGARTAGIVTGAYHYGRPGATPGDAAAEANWLINHISPIKSDDLKPVLDLEVTGGLSTAALQQWALDWLNEVYRLTGRRGTIFTTNSFWKNKMGNTQAIAQAGYALWISYGGSNSSPNVPAGNWGGNGWSFWKYDNCGSVRGISGCVDLDKINGTDLTPYLYGP
jgi:lysozyme